MTRGNEMGTGWVSRSRDGWGNGVGDRHERPGVAVTGIHTHCNHSNSNPHPLPFVGRAPELLQCMQELVHGHVAVVDGLEKGVGLLLSLLGDRLRPRINRPCRKQHQHLTHLPSPTSTSHIPTPTLPPAPVTLGMEEHLLLGPTARQWTPLVTSGGV